MRAYEGGRGRVLVGDGLDEPGGAGLAGPLLGPAQQRPAEPPAAVRGVHVDLGAPVRPGPSDDRAVLVGHHGIQRRIEAGPGQIRRDPVHIGLDPADHRLLVRGHHRMNRGDVGSGNGTKAYRHPVSLHLMTLTVDTALVERLERAEGDRIAAACLAAREREPAAFARPVAAGYACYAGPGSPLNKVVGLGFGGVPAEDEWAAVESVYRELGAPVEVEFAHPGDPAVRDWLTGRGYRLTGFEDVLGRVPGDVTISGGPWLFNDVSVSASPIEELDTWLATVTAGFAATPAFSLDALVRVHVDLSTRPGVTRYLAWVDGAPAGGGTLEVAHGLGEFAAGATRPEFRRRGVQAALLARRLADARAAGCEVAVVTTSPGTQSQRNVRRAGFDLLYTRALLTLS
nr:GNAT family N-acetyltransferase [Hamadaea tsunoensis]